MQWISGSITRGTPHKLAVGLKKDYCPGPTQTDESGLGICFKAPKNDRNVFSWQESLQPLLTEWMNFLIV